MASSPTSTNNNTFFSLLSDHVLTDRVFSFLDRDSIRTFLEAAPPMRTLVWRLDDRYCRIHGTKKEETKPLDTYGDDADADANEDEDKDMDSSLSGSSDEDSSSEEGDDDVEKDNSEEEGSLMSVEEEKLLSCEDCVRALLGFKRCKGCDDFAERLFDCDACKIMVCEYCCDGECSICCQCKKWKSKFFSCRTCGEYVGRSDRTHFCNPFVMKMSLADYRLCQAIKGELSD
jgi:hypothetical protein